MQADPTRVTAQRLWGRKLEDEYRSSAYLAIPAGRTNWSGRHDHGSAARRSVLSATEILFLIGRGTPRARSAGSWPSLRRARSPPSAQRRLGLEVDEGRETRTAGTRWVGVRGLAAAPGAGGQLEKLPIQSKYKEGGEKKRKRKGEKRRR